MSRETGTPGATGGGERPWPTKPSGDRDGSPGGGPITTAGTVAPLPPLGQPRGLRWFPRTGSAMTRRKLLLAGSIALLAGLVLATPSPGILFYTFLPWNGAGKARP